MVCTGIMLCVDPDGRGTPQQHREVYRLLHELAVLDEEGGQVRGGVGRGGQGGAFCRLQRLRAFLRRAG